MENRAWKTQLCQLVEETLNTNKGMDIASIDIGRKSSFADYIVLASGTSRRHVHALCEHVRTRAKEEGHPILSIEGNEDSDWMLLDLGNVIVHIFTPDVRTVYNLEGMWNAECPGQFPQND